MLAPKALLFIILSLNVYVFSSKLQEDPGYFLIEDNTTPIDLDKDFIETTTKCNSQIQLLIGVTSHPNDTIDREKFRNLFAMHSEKSKMVFLTGKTNNPYVDFSMDIEQKVYGDIVKLNFLENYRNLTLKTYGLLKYANDYCTEIKCVVKIDLDVTLNIQNLEQLCRDAPNSDHLITGHVYENPLVFRNLTSKWYVPRYVYEPNEYPDFAYGGLYMLTGYGVSAKLLKNLKTKTPFFNSENFRRLPEDAIFTGMLRDKYVKIRPFPKEIEEVVIGTDMPYTQSVTSTTFTSRLQVRLLQQHRQAIAQTRRVPFLN